MCWAQSEYQCARLKNAKVVTKDPELSKVIKRIIWGTLNIVHLLIILTQ